jgi:transcription elongation factor GreA
MVYNLFCRSRLPTDGYVISTDPPMFCSGTIVEARARAPGQPSTEESAVGAFFSLWIAVEAERQMEEAHSVYVTQEGLKKLQDEYDYLVNVRRPEVASQIAEAKADGDISEHAGYDEAKNAQAFVEGRILTVKNILISAVIIKNNGSKEAVGLGCKVTIRDTEYGDEETYTIVGPTEVDPTDGRISDRSPIGRALLGHRIGDQVPVQSPGGMIEYEIVKIA